MLCLSGACLGPKAQTLCMIPSQAEFNRLYGARLATVSTLAS
jgi:hypothetical protein